MQVRSLGTPLRIKSHEMPWQFNKNNNYQVQCLPVELGNGWSRVYELDRNFIFIDTQYHPNCDLAVISQMNNQEPSMVLTLALKGCSRFSDKQGSEIVFRSGFSTFTTFTVSDGCRHYQSDKTVSQLRFSMTKPWLEQRFGEGAFAPFFNKNGVQIVEQRPISASAIQAAQCMLDSSIRTASQPLFREGLAMAIVAAELNDLANDIQLKVHRITPRDRQIAELAREILHTEYADPPSTEELCLRIGTNEFKLKHLFRYCFDNTPYGMLLDIRMNKAYHILSTNRYSVSATAEAVGYSHASNFSTAFTKYYGFPPKQVFRKTNISRRSG